VRICVVLSGLKNVSREQGSKVGWLEWSGVEMRRVDSDCGGGIVSWRVG
jgi:hypothetical protein